jgi:formylglycine-generating enzyme required for sulfatase activity
MRVELKCLKAIGIGCVECALLLSAGNVQADPKEDPLPEMLCIPGGEYQMGCHEETGEECQTDELPVHDVHVGPFYIGIYETTNEEYCAYLNDVYPSEITVDVRGIVYGVDDENMLYPYCDTYSYDADSRIHWNGNDFSVTEDKEDHPMVQVSWYGAVAYANWRSEQEGFEPSYDLETWECSWNASGYRLPTEAEWEWAARGNNTDPYYAYPWGDEIDGSMANYEDSGDPYEGDPPETTPVDYYDGGQEPPGDDMANGFDLYDMAGNVYEWCHDWYDDSYYSYSPYCDPHGPGTGAKRVLRDGSWDDGEQACRCAARYFHAPEDRGSGHGFRLVRVQQSCCAADINRSGVVDTADLLILLGSWGECP